MGIQVISASFIGGFMLRKRTRTVYGLCDPRIQPFFVRYVGCTAQKVLNRVQAHVWEAATTDMQTPKAEWVRDMVRNGSSPFALILEVVEEDNWQEREAFWIDSLKSPHLLNSTKGGVGSAGFSPEVRERIRQSQIGKKQSAETVAKRKATMLKNPHRHDADTLRRITEARRARAAATPYQPMSQEAKDNLRLKVSSSIWINNGTTNRRINKSDSLPEGWTRGRSKQA